TVFAAQLLQHTAELGGRYVLHADQARDVTVVAGRDFVGRVHRRVFLHARRLDHLQRVAGRGDGQADRIERGQEQPVALLGRDRPGADDGDLLRADVLRDDELLAGHRADPADEIVELALRFERDLDLLARRQLAALIELHLARQLLDGSRAPG